MSVNIAGPSSSSSPQKNRRLDYVRFDVGHYLYLTHKNTLLKFPDSVLVRYISPDFDTRSSESDYIVIDRDGKHFGSIINFMRDRTSLELDSWTDNDLTDLMREADFYCLSELVELCEQQFVSRDAKFRSEQEFHEQTSSFQAPPSRRLEMIFGLSIMREVLAMSIRPTIVISYRSMRIYHIDSWVEELIKMCDHSKFKIFCYAGRSQEPTGQETALHDFILSLYNPNGRLLQVIMPAPPLDKFRAKRHYYKCKLFKCWFMIQHSDMLKTKK